MDAALSAFHNASEAMGGLWGVRVSPKKFRQSSSPQKRFATIATPQRRVRLLGRRLVEVNGVERKERELESEDEVLHCLRSRFGLELQDADNLPVSPGT